MHVIPAAQAPSPNDLQHTCHGNPTDMRTDLDLLGTLRA